MLPEPLDLHRLTRTELELKAWELGEQISELRAMLQDLGPGPAREEALRQRRELRDAVERELAHRRLEDRP